HDARFARAERRPTADVEPGVRRPGGGLRRASLELPHADGPLSRGPSRLRRRAVCRRGGRYDGEERTRGTVGEQGDAEPGNNVGGREPAVARSADKAPSRGARTMLYRLLGEDRNRRRGSLTCATSALVS